MDNTDDITSYKRFIPHEAIIFCVELTESIFYGPSETTERSYLMEILESLLELMTQLIITQPDVGVGCVFYCSDKDEAQNGLFTLLPLKNNNIKHLQKLSNLIDDVKQNRLDLQTFFQRSKEAISLEKLFVYIQEELSKSIPGQTKYNFTRLYLFTDNDSPPESNDEESKKRLRQLSMDMNANFVNITTFFFEDEVNKFDTTFYSDILNVGSAIENEEFDGPNVTPISIESIRARVLSGKEMKRTAFKCPLIISDDIDLKVGIKGYSIDSEEKAGDHYKLVYEHENIQKEAYSSRKYLHPKTGEYIDMSDLIKVMPISNIQMHLTDEEQDKIDTALEVNESYLKIIGYRSSEKCLKYFDNIDRTVFIYPDEKQFIGSFKVMASLFRNLRSKGKIALVWGKPRLNSNWSLYLLRPSDVNDKNEGFFLHKVPCIDDIRKVPTLPLHYTGEETEEYKSFAVVSETIINSFGLRTPYQPENYRNPSLQKYYNLLHDYLLDKEAITASSDNTEDVDDTLAKISRIRERIEASSLDTSEEEGRLSKYFEVWNKLYEKIDDENKVELPPKKKSKKPVLNL